MKVLSLFDGMSCGQIALDRLGIKVDKYYASEIDKYAMQVTQANFPETIQVGDICKLDPKDFMDVDLILAGSPCQGFSFAGKQLAFDDPRSALFFEFIRLLKAIKPKYFLLENVKMKKDYLQIISEQVSACYPEIPFGIEPIFINSSLVSAQSRQRYYWTNIPNITQPEERGIVLRDILEDQVGSEHYVGYQLQKNYAGGNQLNPKYKSQANTIHDVDKKSGTICAGTHGYANGYIGDKHKPVKDTERNRRHMKNLDEKSLCMTATMYKGAGNNGMTIVPQPILDDNLDKMTTKDGKAYALTTTYGAAGAKDSLEKKRRSMIPTSNKPDRIATAVDVNGLDHMKRVYSPDGKSPTVTTCQGGNTEPKVAAGAWRGRSLDESGKNVKWKETKPKQMLETRKDEKSNAVSTFTKDNLVVHSYREVRTEEAKKARRENRQKTGKDHTPFRAKELQPRDDGKVGTVTPSLNSDHRISLTKDSTQDVYWRKLTPLECERLQTVPDNYTNHVSNTQRYKMLGNGWTIEVIAHIFKNMEVGNDS
jgi:DNA-cytosine methyltransferase